MKLKEHNERVSANLALYTHLLKNLADARNEYRDARTLSDQRLAYSQAAKWSHKLLVEFGADVPPIARREYE
jgi:hypothetical protein